jgi:hypothetical protein
MEGLPGVPRRRGGEKQGTPCGNLPLAPFPLPPSFDVLTAARTYSPLAPMEFHRCL